jgi:hypothetical protein
MLSIRIFTNQNNQPITDMHAYYKQITPPTAVEHVLRANFTHETIPNLLVAKSNILEVFVVNDDSKLELVNSFELFGNIESMEKIRFLDNKRDSLILTFAEAKVSFIDFDLQSNDLKTISLYYLEDEFLKEGCLEFSSKPKIKVDKRCCAMLLYDYKLAIIPFLQADYGKEKSSREVPTIKQIIIDIKEIGLDNIKDYCFLSGYYEPTLLILHDTEKTSCNRIHLKKNTSMVSCISLDLQRKHYPIIWTVKNLPSTSYQLIPLQEPVGGAMVIGYESMIHVNQKATYGISLSDFSKLEENHLPVSLAQIPDCLVMNGIGLPITRDRILFSIGQDIWVLQMEFDSNHAIRKMFLQKLASLMTESSCMCLVAPHMLFFGSRLGDSHLATFAEKREASSDNQASKKKKVDEDDYLAQLEAEEKGMMEADVDFKYDFRIVDTLINIGPISCFTVSETPGHKDKLDIITCSGYSKHSSLSILRKTIRPHTNIEVAYGNDIKRLISIQNLVFFGIDKSTRVSLVTEKELNEVFQLDDTILNVGTIGSHFVFIFENKLRLVDVVEKVKILDEIKTEAVLRGFVFDNLVMLHLHDGTLRFYSVLDKITPLQPKISKGYGKIASLCMSEGRVVVGWSSGCLEIYTIEKGELRVVFTSLRAGALLSVLQDESPTQEEVEEFINLNQSEGNQIKQIVLKKMEGHLYLILLMENTKLVIYKKFGSGSGFFKISHRHYMTKDVSATLIPFNNVDGRSGIFLTGEKPAFLFTSKGFLYVHPIECKEAIKSFAEFHNENCQHGFVFSTVSQQLVFSTLGNVMYERDWTLKRIPLDATPSAIAYHRSKPAYLVSTFSEVPLADIEVKLVGRFPEPTERQFQLRLLHSRTFQQMSHYDLDPHEHVSEIKVCNIAPKDDDDDIRKDYVPSLIVGTSFVQHDDIGARGRLYMFDLEHKDKKLVLNKVSVKELRGPCSAICELDGYVACVAGPKIYVCYYDWDLKQFVFTAFFDTQFYCTSMVSMKRFVCFGDRFESSTLLNWKKHRGNALDFLAKDYNRLQVTSIGFLVHEGKLGLVVADLYQNIQIFGYKPNDKNLVAQADFNIGGMIKEFVRLKVPNQEKAQMNVFGRVDGSIGCLIPISEGMHRRFNALQVKMYTYVGHAGGLHPKAFRLFKPESHSLHNPKKNVIDGELVSKMMDLNVISQKDLTKQIGYTAEDLEQQIMEMEKFGINF